MSYYLGHERAFRVVEADIVTTEDGTGLVHTAGAFGEEDKVVTDREGIEPVVPVAKDGTFTPPVDDYAGLHVFEANLAIIDHLRAMTKGTGETGSVTPGTVLLRRESYEHSYPHCWRCREPLIYMAVSSWFVVDHQDPRPDARPQPADPVGARPRQGRPVRQVAGEHPRLVDLPQPLLGLADPGLAQRRPGVPPRRRLRLARRARARLRRAARRPAPAVHRPADAPQPGRPDREARRCAGSPTSWTAGSSPGR